MEQQQSKMSLGDMKHHQNTTQLHPFKKDTKVITLRTNNKQQIKHSHKEKIVNTGKILNQPIEQIRKSSHPH